MLRSLPTGLGDPNKTEKLTQGKKILTCANLAHVCHMVGDRWVVVLLTKKCEKNVEKKIEENILYVASPPRKSKKKARNKQETNMSDIPPLAHLPVPPSPAPAGFQRLSGAASTMATAELVNRMAVGANNLPGAFPDKFDATVVVKQKGEKRPCFLCSLEGHSGAQCPFTVLDPRTLRPIYCGAEVMRARADWLQQNEKKSVVGRPPYKNLVEEQRAAQQLMMSPGSWEEYQRRQTESRQVAERVRGTMSVSDAARDVSRAALGGSVPLLAMTDMRLSAAAPTDDESDEEDACQRRKAARYMCCNGSVVRAAVAPAAAEEPQEAQHVVEQRLEFEVSDEEEEVERNKRQRESSAGSLQQWGPTPFEIPEMSDEELRNSLLEHGATLRNMQRLQHLMKAEAQRRATKKELQEAEEEAERSKTQVRELEARLKDAKAAYVAANKKKLRVEASQIPETPRRGSSRQ